MSFSYESMLDETTYLEVVVRRCAPGSRGFIVITFEDVFASWQGMERTWEVANGS